MEWKKNERIKKKWKWKKKREDKKKTKTKNHERVDKKIKKNDEDEDVNSPSSDKEQPKNDKKGVTRLSFNSEEKKETVLPIIKPISFDKKSRPQRSNSRSSGNKEGENQIEAFVKTSRMKKKILKER